MNTMTNPHTSAELSLGTYPTGHTASTGHLLTLAAQLDAAGFPLGDAMTRAHATLQAVTDLQTGNPTAAVFGSVADLTALPPEDVADLVNRAALAHLLLTSNALGTAQQGFHAVFAVHLARELRRVSDDVVRSMRPVFDGAMATVAAAHKIGLTPATTRDEILERADAKRLAAFRDLGPAVATLDQLAVLRVTMCNSAGIGPAGKAIACLVDPRTKPDLDGAANIYVGNLGTVMVPNANPSAGPSAHLIASPRLGGRWLDLLAHGYTPRLNTADEADALAAADD